MVVPLKPAIGWGRLPTPPAAVEVQLTDRHARLPARSGMRMLAHGLGRSYGDVGLNDGALLLRTRGLDRFISFCDQTGVLRAEAGVSLAEVLALVVPRGWVLPVTPGTRYVTLGGAVANDVHGKNHHVAGSFGHHVRRLALMRSDGRTLECASDENSNLFRATIGGLGLTGLMLWVELQLVPWVNGEVAVHRKPFGSLDEFWDLDAELAPSATHTVSWVDVGRGGRGIYSAADAQTSRPARPLEPLRAPAFSVPFAPPVSLIRPWTCSVFNAAVYHRPRQTDSRMPWLDFLYPLDAVGNWNRVYGRRGFMQYQCVLPTATQRLALPALIRLVARRGLDSSLTVLKSFANHAPAGLLSFPLAGVTLAMDFPNEGDTTLRHFNEFDSLVKEAGGRLYPAKDARMSPAMFRAGYPDIGRFVEHLDAGFSSSFWRRVCP